MELYGEGERVLGFDRYRFLAVKSDGTVRRLFGNKHVEASPYEFVDGVKSKDVSVNKSTGLSVRMFLPNTGNSNKERMPALFYAHGGGFCVDSAASFTYHTYLSRVASELKVLCVSVDYRRCPEYRLPAAYEDCLEALEWLLVGQGRNDPWISELADLQKVFLAGDSAGGNIVHEVGIRARRVEWGPRVNFAGAIFMHPYFVTQETDGNRDAVRFQTDFFRAVCLAEDEDINSYPPFNPVGPRSPPLSDLVYERMLVAVAEKDFLRDAGLDYYRALVTGSRKVELFVTPDQRHVFHLIALNSPPALLLMERLRLFILRTPAGLEAE